ncbi:MAG: hypothetical protein U0163_00335 [Gemmatimonadaceae bacterium]
MRRLVHLPHPTAAEEPFDSVGPELVPSLESNIDVDGFGGGYRFNADVRRGRRFGQGGQHAGGADVS